MYSTKNIERILLAEKRKNLIQAAPLNEKTLNQYIYLETEEEIVKALQLPEYSDAVAAFKKGKRIYRGDKSQEEHLGMFITPGIRVSQNVSNIYTKLMSELLPSWRKYPRRDKCAVCTNSQDMAYHYSKVYCFSIFPQNGTKIGVCSGSDIWDSFPFLFEMANIYSLTEFVDIIEYLFELVLSDEIDTPKLFRQDVNTIQNVIKQLEKELRKQPYRDFSNINRIELIRYIISEIRHGKSFLRTLNFLMNPRENEFRLVSIKNIPVKGEYGSNELWFEGQYLMIREDIARHII